jgi:hypothetical protein
VVTETIRKQLADTANTVLTPANTVSTEDANTANEPANEPANKLTDRKAYMRELMRKKRAAAKQLK